MVPPFLSNIYKDTPYIHFFQYIICHLNTIFTSNRQKTEKVCRLFLSFESISYGNLGTSCPRRLINGPPVPSM